MRAIHGRNWNIRQFRDETDTQHQSGLRMHQTSRTQVNHRKTPLWSDSSRISSEDDHTTKNCPQDTKIQKFLANVTFPKSKKQVQRYIGFFNFDRNYIPRLSEKLLRFYELLKADKRIKVTEALLDHYKAINAALAEA